MQITERILIAKIKIASINYLFQNPAFATLLEVVCAK
jgi:hypothetical protein